MGLPGNDLFPSDHLLHVYLNGIEVSYAVQSAGDGSALPDSSAVGIGLDGGNNYAFNLTGTMDEVRIANTSRSAGWIATEYHNQSSPETFYSVGAEQNAGEAGTVATPTISPAGGIYSLPQSVTISTTTPNATIRYTTDGSTPTETVGTVYTRPFTVATSAMVNAIGYEAGWAHSAVASATYGITGWYNSAWAHRKVITISHTQVSGAANLTNFPVLVSLTSDPNLPAEAKSDGSDLLFTDSSGTLKLNHEIEKYSSANGQLLAWVQVPSLSPTVDTTIYLYYGNSSAADQQNKAAVWSAGYQGVWHFGSAAPLTDSTGNGNTLSSTGTTAVNGQIGGVMSSPAPIMTASRSTRPLGSIISPAIHNPPGSIPYRSAVRRRLAVLCI